jgi:16S rRNA (adenine1518-N6/adenine1519-N6)-dimethyltransferase
MRNLKPSRAETSAGQRPRKRFGQHFLHDPGVIRRIVAAIDPRPGEHLVEIGPGRGALTRALLPLVGHLDAVELDRDLIPSLQATCAPLGELTVHQADALRFDFDGLRGDARRLRVVGNLPYNISTPLLFHLLDQVEAVEDMHFMLQQEVVERLAAAPGSGAYGRLGVMVQYRCRIEPLFSVAPGAFSPPPRVTSAVVRLTPYRSPPVQVDNLQTLARLVNQAFSRRRKTLRNALRELISAKQLAQLGIAPTLRPENLRLEDFARISNTLSQAGVDED